MKPVKSKLEAVRKALELIKQAECEESDEVIKALWALESKYIGKLDAASARAQRAREVRMAKLDADRKRAAFKVVAAGGKGHCVHNVWFVTPDGIAHFNRPNMEDWRENHR